MKDHDSYHAQDHLRVTEKLLRAIEHLGHSENSCNHVLVRSYAVQAMGHLQAARRLLFQGVAEDGGAANKTGDEA